MEYLYTNLPRYITVTPRSAFANSVVQSGSVLLFSEDGSTLTAKLPDGSFITVGGSGGTDVSDTTAEAGDVLSGKIFYDSAGSLTSGGIQIQSAQTITPATSDQIISSGVYLGGSQTILGDSALVASNIVSGASIFGVSGTYTGSGGADVILGYVSSGVFFELAFSGTSSVEAGSSAGLSAYGWNLPVSSSVSGGVILMSGGTLVSSASYMSSEGVSSGGVMTVYSGGYTSDIDVYMSGWQVVSSGGTTVSTMVHSGGTLWVSSGGTALEVISFGGAVISSSFGGYIQYKPISVYSS